MKNTQALLIASFFALASCQMQNSPAVSLEGKNALSFEKIENAEEPRNIIFILSDDHRYDFMGFTGKVSWLKTPNMDRLAREGAYFPNTFVTTSLCSPSRASILTGLYSHSHTVIDNQSPAPDDLIYFPQYLQQVGYETGFFGKWHMGDDSAHPRSGFDHWESFRGQGKYYNPTLNINGKEVHYKDSTYVTDLLTKHSLDWLKSRKPDKPFFLYLSHKAVHSMFMPAERHEGDYENEKIIYPPSYSTSDEQVKGKRKFNEPEGEQDYKPYLQDEYYGEGRRPDWTRMQRESWHGVDYMYHGKTNFEDFYRDYAETLKAVDEGVGDILDYLDESGLAETTMVVYMGDNGFSFGEHGLIDKRHFYEESVKVPFLVRLPEVLKGGQTIEKMVQNIDVAPTFLELAGIKKPDHMQGKSIMPLLREEQVEWRDRIFYEYYWEYSFPQTPTMHGVRTDRYKLIRYHGVWDTNEFYDLQEDPNEMNNLIASPEHQGLIKELSGEIYEWLEETGGMNIPLKRTVRLHSGDHRNRGLY
jgi:arylsulfatase A-like enzyme